MSLYAKSYERVLKRYDGDLFIDRNPDGILCVFRKVKRFVPVIETEEFRLMNLSEGKEYVFALTDTWGLSGNERDFGVDDVLDHLQKIDSLANARFMEAFDEANAEAERREKRALRNEMEAFFSHERNRFVKVIDENVGTTTSMDKTETKKRLKDRRIKNGNY